MLRDELAEGGKLAAAFVQWNAVEELRRDLLSLDSQAAEDRAEVQRRSVAVAALKAQLARAEDDLQGAEGRLAQRPREAAALEQRLRAALPAALEALSAEWRRAAGEALRPPAFHAPERADDAEGALRDTVAEADPLRGRPRPTADRVAYDTAEGFRGGVEYSNAPRKPPDDLRVVARRLAYKAQAATQVAKPGTHADLAAQADGFLLADWFAALREGPPADAAAAETIAGCYRAAEEAALALAPFLDAPESLDADRGKPLLAAAAAAQSSLRSAALRFLPRNLASDRDQLLVFHGVKFLAYERQIYVDRYLRADDLADPMQWHEWQAGVHRCRERFEGDKQRSKHLQSIRFAANRLSRGDGQAAASWETLSNRTTQLVKELRTPVNNVELREALLPALDARPDDAAGSPELEEALASAQAWRAERDDAEAEGPERAVPQIVVEARRLLAGKRAIFVGGTPDPNAERRLREAFGLADLEWVVTREHQSTAPFQAPVSRPETALVLCALRLSGHAFDDDLKELCDRYGKAYVRLPRGWSVVQVAYETLRQASGKLEGLAVAG